MVQALLIMFVAMSLIPAGDTAGKLLTTVHGASPVFVAWTRFLLGGLAALVIARPGWARIFLDWRIWMRSLLLLGGITSIQTALTTAPVASAFAAFFIGPIFSYALSVVLLREQVTPLRTALMALGFVGVLVVVRPGFGAEPGLGFALLAGLFYGAFLTAGRWMAGIARPRALMAAQFLIPALLLTPFGLTTQMPDLSPTTAGLTLASALCSMGGNLLLFTAYGRAGASVLAPFVYFQLIAATGLGWLVFSDLPDALTWAGLAIIVGAGAGSALAARPGPRRA
ncbi:Threonine/homoserine efflux transporter RhtA [Salinihabitans flavidus]|uniref:Threonine/homoserine efflux transporter RhtA n=1 Tax=Salinihabitans flavidus TaxID=569882 RepID=A0A1H8TNE5_9RHOB|nr:DMT family transporter [Salinihabitans flavidus]SEO92134.1 Threonine/homoserine efflux transporter RhtA [Salinihabitans flavidus]